MGEQARASMKRYRHSVQFYKYSSYFSLAFFFSIRRHSFFCVRRLATPPENRRTRLIITIPSIFYRLLTSSMCGRWHAFELGGPRSQPSKQREKEAIVVVVVFFPLFVYTFCCARMRRTQVLSHLCSRSGCSAALGCVDR